MNKKQIYVAVALSFLVPLMTIMSIRALDSGNSEPAIAEAAEAEPLIEMEGDDLPTPITEFDEDLPHMRHQWLRDVSAVYQWHILQDQVSLEEAEARLGVPIPVPTYYIDDAPWEESIFSINVDRSGGASEPEYEHAIQVYHNGLVIIFMLRQENAATVHETFSERPEADYVLFEVNGEEAAGREPMTQVFESGSEHRAAGFVTWQVDGTTIEIYGDFPLEELLAVAESMEY